VVLHSFKKLLTILVLIAMADVKAEDQMALLERDEEFAGIVEKLQGGDKAKLLALIKSNMLPLEATQAPPGEPEGPPEGQPETPVNANVVPQSNIPKLGTFSGDDPVGKGEIPYDQWKQEVKCLTRENYSDNVVMLSIRRSLKSTASSVLVNLGANVTSDTVLDKFEIVFGNVLPSEMLLESFYTARQNETESIVAWGCRIESLLNKAKQQGTITGTEDMARTKFWSGIRDERVKAALRHKFDSGENFQELLKNGRMLEHEFNVKSPSVKLKSQSVEVPSELKSVLSRMDKLEKKVSQLLGKDSKPTNSETSQLFCRYCKRTNHTIEDCRILARKKAKASENSDQSASGTAQ